MVEASDTSMKDSPSIHPVTAAKFPSYLFCLYIQVCLLRGNAVFSLMGSVTGRNQRYPS